MAARLTACSTPCMALQLKLGDQILAEEKHLPLYKVYNGGSSWLCCRKPGCWLACCLAVQAQGSASFSLCFSIEPAGAGRSG